MTATVCLVCGLVQESLEPKTCVRCPSWPHFTVVQPDTKGDTYVAAAKATFMLRGGFTSAAAEAAAIVQAASPRRTHNPVADAKRALMRLRCAEEWRGNEDQAPCDPSNAHWQPCAMCRIE